MRAYPNAYVSQSSAGVRPHTPRDSRLIVAVVNLIRKGRAEPFLDTSPTLSSVHVDKGLPGCRLKPGLHSIAASLDTNIILSQLIRKLDQETRKKSQRGSCAMWLLPRNVRESR
jgi:hypothetical protein